MLREAAGTRRVAVCFHRRGMVHDRTFDDQRLRAGGLNLVVAAIVYWNTVYLEQAVAMLGAANSLLAMVLDRRREFGVLRYLGAAPAQVRRMILLEAGFLGLAANLLGLTLGFVLSLVLIYVINKQSFGWTIQFHPPIALLAGASALVWMTTVLAGIYPARVAARLNPIEVIHEE